MSYVTTNYNLKKPLGSENYNILDQNGNMDILDLKLKEVDDKASNIVVPVTTVNSKTGDVVLTAADVLDGNGVSVAASLADTNYQLATGTGTAITLTLPALVNLYTKTFIASADNSGSATTINSKPLYKPNTVIAPNLTTGKAYTVWYNLANDCFFLKASAEGDATVADVLAPKTFSNGDDTGLVGTMADRGAINITPGTTNQAILGGKHSGLGIVYGDANLMANNIVDTANIFDVQGNVHKFVATPGDDILIRGIDGWNNSGATEKSSETILKIGGTYTISYDHSCRSDGYDYPTTAQIYINGSPRGTKYTLDTEDSATYTRTQNFTVNPGDAVQIYTYIEMTYLDVYVRNIYFKVDISQFATKVNV